MSRTRLLVTLIALSITLIAALAAPLTLRAQDGSALPVPAGRLIVGDDRGLYTMRADGSEQTYLIEENEPGCWLRDGAWSPDRARLLYTRICGGSSPTDWHAADRTASIFVYELDKQSSSELIANSGAYQDYAGGWHPDGQRIVIYSNRNEDRYNLYLVDTLSGETTQLSDYDGDVGRASFDPTGRYLLYNRYVVETDAIRWEVRALDTTTNVEVPVAVGLTPRWSPDGQWIAYTTEGETADVFVMPATCILNNTPCDAGTTARNITYTPDIAEREPVWSPDQTQIVYLRDTDTNLQTLTWDLYRHDLRTGLLQNLTNTPDVKERLTAWEPLADAAPVAVDSLLPVVLRVTSGTANLRAQPNTNANIVGVSNNGQIVFAHGVNPARDWYYITLPADGTQAWLYGNLVAVEAGDPANLPEAEVQP